MNVLVIGATGMIGAEVVAEAVSRGHQVTAASRSGKAVNGAQDAVVLDLGNTAEVVAKINAAEVTVIAVPSDRTGGSHEPTINAHKALIAARPTSRVIVVGGAGSLVIGGVALKDTEGFPDIYKAEANTFTDILNFYRDSSGLNWTVVSPAPMIAPGARTGEYKSGLDSPVGDSISAEDFAVAIVDEIDAQKHKNQRFTVAN